MKPLIFFLFITTASLAYAEDVTIDEHYPASTAKHQTVNVYQNLKLVNPFQVFQPGLTVYGNMTVTGALRYGILGANPPFLYAGCTDSNGSPIPCSAEITGTWFRFGPRWYDPANGSYAPGLNSNVTVNPFFKTRDFFASTNIGLVDNAYTYLAARGSGPSGRAYIGAARQNGVPYEPLGPDAPLIPLKIEGSPIIFNPFPPVAPGGPNIRVDDFVEYYFIGRLPNPFVLPVENGYVLWVFGTGYVETMETFSSREFKTDISPLSKEDYSNALATLQAVQLVHYRFKDDVSREEHLGIIAEDAPKELVTNDRKGLNIPNSIGFLAATVKELKTKNDALKARLEVLRQKKAELMNAKP